MKVLKKEILFSLVALSFSVMASGGDGPSNLKISDRVTNIGGTPSVGTIVDIDEKNIHKVRYDGGAIVYHLPGDIEKTLDCFERLCVLNEVTNVGGTPSIGIILNIEEGGIYKVRYDGGAIVYHLPGDIKRLN